MLDDEEKLSPEQVAMLLALIQQIAAGQNCTLGSPSLIASANPVAIFSYVSEALVIATVLTPFGDRTSDACEFGVTIAYQCKWQIIINDTKLVP